MTAGHKVNLAEMIMTSRMIHTDSVEFCQRGKVEVSFMKQGKWCFTFRVMCRVKEWPKVRLG